MKAAREAAEAAEAKKDPLEADWPWRWYGYGGICAAIALLVAWWYSRG